MLSALQGSAFAKTVLTGFNDAAWSPLEGLSDRAIEMASYILTKSGAGSDTVVSTLDRLVHNSARERISVQHIADCLSVAIKLAIDAEQAALDLRDLIVHEASIHRVPLDEINLKGVVFQDCMIREITFGDGLIANICFQGCLIDRVIGAATRDGIPLQVVAADCMIDAYDNLSTNSAVLSSDASPQMKALLTVLRKLYKQSGSGRKLGAFTRGITKQEVLGYIDPVIGILKKHQFISVFNSVVHPVRKQGSRVESILAAPALSADALVLEVRALK
jgi:hypothetical protein